MKKSPSRHEGEIFGPHLRELRVARGLTQTELAERARSGLQFISRLERGMASPTLGMLIRLADALDCQLYDLVEIFDRTRGIRPKSRKD